MSTNKTLLAVIFAIALFSSIAVNNTVLAKSKHDSKVQTNNNNVTNTNNPLLTTGLKTICWNGIVEQNATVKKAVICEALTIQAIK